MINKLIDWCIDNRFMVIVLVACLIGISIWAMLNIKLDAIPDLSDVQVIIRTEYAGQAPQIVEDQITYPLTTAMLSVPYAKVVRGYSMFGTSFVYIIFDDGTDIYWARSRVLEQLSSLTSRLPAGVSPQLGPDATGVGWVYQYMLITGKYCPDHIDGLWHDPATDQWFESLEEVPDAKDRELVHQRIFSSEISQYYDPETKINYVSKELAPQPIRSRLKKLVLSKQHDTCPITGQPLSEPDIDLAQLRSLQDWYLRYELITVEGVSEVAPVGGFIKQYQVTLDPIKLHAYDLSLKEVRRRIKGSNIDVGGRLLEMAETEYMVRGLGYLATLTDSQIAEAEAAGIPLNDLRTEAALEQLRLISMGATASGSPIYLRDIANVNVGPEIRRGIAEWNGEGETVGGIVVMRFGENARSTIDGIKEKLAELEKGLPPGVAIAEAYDRSDLIDRAVETLAHTLIEEITVVSLIVILFLIHARSALIAVIVIPTGVLGSILMMHLMGINANIMSLGGIAIAIGVMVDSSIIMVENAHNHFEREKKRILAGNTPRPWVRVIADSAKEVGPSLFFSLLIITVSFFPVFALGEQSGRLFKPLAFTKTFSMSIAAVLAVTLIPVLMVYFIREEMLPKSWSMAKKLTTYGAFILGPGILLALIPMHDFLPYRWWFVLGWVVLSSLIILPQRILPEEKNPISKLLFAIYNPFFVLTMKYRKTVLLLAVSLVLVTIWPLMQLGSEFMPPLEEGDFLYMPNADPGLSVTKAKELLQQTDKLIKQFPEVLSVMGKIGRAETATDPAPLTMIETTIILERDKSKWRQLPTKGFLGLFPGTRAITLQELTDGYLLPNGVRVPGINDSLKIPGLTGALTRGSMPIKTRIDMLATGIKTPIGIKVLGPNLKTLARLSDNISQILKTDSAVKNYTATAISDRSVGGNYLDIRIDRQAIARYDLLVEDIQAVIMTALGGMNVTFTIEGRERYPLNIRYSRELRDNLSALKQTLVKTKSGAQIPLAQLVDFELKKGPPMIRSENARPTSWVYVDIKDIDIGTYVAEAKKAVAAKLDLPDGYSIVWSGQFEYMEAANKSLMLILPITFIIIILLLYMATHSLMRTTIVLLAVPFSLVGAIWLLFFLNFNISVAVWVGMIALAGLDVETGLVMLLYLDNSYDRFKGEGRMRNEQDLWHAVHDGAVKRIRPKTMTVVTTFIGLMPLMFAAGAGADTMRRLAAPMLGGLFTSFIMELLIYPVIFFMVKKVSLGKQKEVGRVAE